MRAVGFALYAGALTLMPALVVGWNHGAMAPFWLLAGDAYLYLGIGEASQGLAMSFDGLRPTNGFHPLWQVWVRLATALAEGLGGGPVLAMGLVAWGAVGCTLGGVLFLGAAIRRLTGAWLPALLVVPGVYYLVIGQALRNLPVWAFFDGMEAGLAFLLAGLLLWLIARGAGALALGMVLALLVVTRLDEIFAVAGLLFMALTWPGRTRTRRMREGVTLILPSLVLFALYMGWSQITTGGVVPINGAAKGEGALLQNGWVTLATVLAPLIDLREGVSAYAADRAALLGGAFRVTELVVPALFAAALLVALAGRFREQPWAPLLAGLCLGVVLKAGYLVTSVNYWHQASWYFALAMALTSLGAALLLAPLFRRLTCPGRTALALALTTLTLLHASLWTQALMTDPLRPEARDFWTARAATEAAIRATEPEPRLMEFGDGMLNFALEFPVRHGFVFAGDRQSLIALREQRLLRDAYADGFRLLSSFEYLRVPPGAEDWDSERIRAFLADSFLDGRVKAELPAFDFEMIHVARPEGVPFIRLIPRE